MSGIGKARRGSYRLARLLGDVQAAERGPLPLARRVARRKVYAKANGGLYRLLRSAGLGR